MTSSHPTDSELRDGRADLTRRYLSALRTLGDLPLGGQRLRDRLRIGATDWWLASETRESSLWRDPSLGDQVVALLRESGTASSGTPKLERHRVRAALAWLRSLLHSLHIPTSAELNADIVFVDYWTASSANSSVNSPTNAPTTTWTSAYFADLPARLMASGLSVAHLHIHSDGPITKPFSAARHAVKELNVIGTRHLLVAGVLSPRLVGRALVKWLRLQFRTLQVVKALDDSVANDDLRRLLPWWRGSLAASLWGGHSVRVAILSELFGRVVSANPDTKLWVVAFEGQNWEACVSRQMEHHDARWIPYLHTMMRPWDLRARTFISEAPLSRVAVHGQHDTKELSGLGASLVQVEALRYQHFATRSSTTSQPPHSREAESTSSSQRTWLIVGGADCAASRRELEDFVIAMARLDVVRKLVVRWHPQCEVPRELTNEHLTFTSEPLSVLSKRVHAAYMVGSAAPLDTFLSGIPSCSLRSVFGLEMSPIKEGPGHHVAETAKELVNWMVESEPMRGFAAPVDYFFTVDPELPGWVSAVRSML